MAFFVNKIQKKCEIFSNKNLRQIDCHFLPVYDSTVTVDIDYNDIPTCCGHCSFWFDLSRYSNTNELNH